MVRQLVLDRVSKCFGMVTALDDFSLEVFKGEFLSLLAPSGCGKTTILRIIAGLLDPDRGEIVIDEQTVFSAAKKLSVPAEDRRVSMVFQSYALWPHMRVCDNIAYALKLHKVPRDEIGSRVENMLALVDLAGLGGRYPHELSGGQQQRVALARALISDPKILLLDEPLSNLDVKLRERMRLELKEIQERVGATIVYVTHDQAEALAMSDRIAVIDQGRMQQVGTPMQLYETPVNSFVAEFVGNSNILRAVVEEGGERGPQVAPIHGTQHSHLRLAVPYGTRPGAEVKLVFHPENARLLRCDSGYGGVANRDEGGDTCLPGLVLRRQYRGREIEYMVQTGDEIVRVVGPCSACFQEGDSVAVEIRAGLVLQS